MATGTLYTYPDNFRAYKGLIAAKYSGSKVTIAPNFKLGETNKSNDFLQKFPLGKVPAFVSDDGTTLFESNAIAFYLSSNELRGNNAKDTAQIWQWINFGDNEICPASCTWVFPCMGIMPFNKQSSEKAKEEIKACLNILNKHLETKTYLVGERISLADISVCCNLLHLYKWVLEPSFRQPYTNVNRWFTTMINQPNVKSVIESFPLCEKMAQFDGKKFAEMHGKTKPEKKEKHEEKQENRKSPKKEEKEEVLDEPPKERSTDPFSKCPKTSFVFDDWKKQYSNFDVETVALPYFWENFDKENCSIWKCDYKFADELRMTFMTSNLIRGMFQRLDKMRKNSFGSMVVTGVDNNNTIHGLWLWRGQDLAFTLDDNLQIDYESYDWVKLDPNSDETKQMVRKYFVMKEEFFEKFCDGQIFK